MFTGIIEAMAAIKEVTGSRLTVERPQSFDDIKIGSSICVSGTCLSVVEFDDVLMRFDVVPETFKCTKLGSLRVGEKVNLERSLKASDRLEGHVVQGHVESVGCVVSPSPQPPSPTRGGGLWKEVLYSKSKVSPAILKYARAMRREPTRAEAVLWKAIRRRQIEGMLFRRQHPIGTRIIDFYCHKVRLGVEVDGKIHEKKEIKERDRDMKLILEDREVKLLRFTNDEVLHHLAWVIEKIERSIQDPPLPVGEGMGERELKRGAGGEGDINVEEGLGVEGRSEKNKTSLLLTITVPNALLKYIIPKGSISLDGVSLTVASIEGNSVTVALIPHTLEQTTLGVLKDGDKVNIETDVMAKHANQLLLSTT